MGSLWPQVGGCFGGALVMFYLLRLLLKMANQARLRRKRRLKRAEEERAEHRGDPFYARNGYNWDYVFVFNIIPHTDETTPKQKEFSMQKIIKSLNDAGLETKQFLSAQKDEVFCKVRCSLDRLKREADRIDYKLHLDPENLKIEVARGRSRGDVVIWAKGEINIQDEHNVSNYGVYEHIYGKYDMEESLQCLYEKHGHKRIPFRGVDRLKLMQTIMRARHHDGGSFLDTAQLQKDKCILGAFPLHENEERLELEAKLLVALQMPWNMPVDDIRNYFGEKIGLYFLWLGHYTNWLLGSSIVGFICWINVAAQNNDPDAALVPYFGGFMAFWATFFLEFWKRKESRYAMEWGMAGFEEEEEDRPQFEGVQSTSPIDGSPYLYYPSKERQKWMAIGQTIIWLLVTAVVAIVGSIFVLKVYLTGDGAEKVGNQGAIICSLLNAVQIQVMNIIYGGLALHLNRKENHRTDTEFEDNLIAKNFMFQMVNSYASLVYISFFKVHLEGACLVSCMTELQTQLGTIFITRLIVGNLTEVGVPFLKKWKKARDETAGTDRAGGLSSIDELSAPEQEYIAEKYDVLLGTFADYLEMVIQYGYATIFVSAFPLAPLMAFVNNYIEIRVDGWKLLQICQRPEPRGAEDIGTWQSILEVMSTLAVIVNCALVCFTGKFMENISLSDRFLYFIVFEHAMLLVKYIFAVIVPDVPEEVTIQLKRNEFLVDKVINEVAEEDDDDLLEGISVQCDLTIAREDDHVV